MYWNLNYLNIHLHRLDLCIFLMVTDVKPKIADTLIYKVKQFLQNLDTPEMKDELLIFMMVMNVMLLLLVFNFYFLEN